MGQWASEQMALIDIWYSDGNLVGMEILVVMEIVSELFGRG